MRWCAKFETGCAHQLSMLSKHHAKFGMPGCGWGVAGGEEGDAAAAASGGGLLRYRKQCLDLSSGMVWGSFTTVRCPSSHLSSSSHLFSSPILSPPLLSSPLRLLSPRLASSSLECRTTHLHSGGSKSLHAGANRCRHAGSSAP